MKFHITANELNSALNMVCKALPGKSPNPALESVLIDAGANGVTMTCTDEKMSIVTRANAEVDEEGRGIVPARMFQEIARHMNGADIEISMDGRFRFTLRGHGTRMNVAGNDADLFPANPESDEGDIIRIPSSVLRDMISRVQTSVAAEDMREILTGIYLEQADGWLNAVGMDGYRLSLAKTEYPDSVNPVKAIVPGRALIEIGKLLPQTDAECALCVSKGHLRVTLGDTRIQLKLIGGEYIDYRSILPQSFGTKITIDLAQLRACVERSAIIARQNSGYLATFDIRDGEMTVESRASNGESHETLNLESKEGGDLKIAFNVRYIQDVVRNCDGQFVTLNFTNAIRPCIINPVGESVYYHLILPVRTQQTAQEAKA